MIDELEKEGALKERVAVSPHLCVLTVMCPVTPGGHYIRVVTEPASDWSVLVT